MKWIYAVGERKNNEEEEKEEEEDDDDDESTQCFSTHSEEYIPCNVRVCS